MRHLTPVELSQWNAGQRPPGAMRERPVILDVREAWELEQAQLDPAQWCVTWAPMGTIPGRLNELMKCHPPDQDLVVLCHHGVRSRAVAGFLERNGFERIWNVSGGIDAIARTLDPDLPVY